MKALKLAVVAYGCRNYRRRQAYCWTRPRRPEEELLPDKQPERRSIWRVGPESTWTTVLPVAFIIVSLVSLVVLPLVVENRTTKMREEISRAAEPARRTANQVQMDLAAEIDKINALQVTDQRQYRAEYQQLLDEQRRGINILKRYAPQLGGDAPPPGSGARSRRRGGRARGRGAGGAACGVRRGGGAGADDVTRIRTDDCQARAAHRAESGRGVRGGDGGGGGGAAPRRDCASE